MPPRTRTNKLSKASKENAVVSLKKAAEKNNIRAVKDKRKPLADKTNSASDENDSKLTNKDTMRPRRDKRLPSRFIDNNLLVNLSTSFSHSTPVKTVQKREVSTKDEVTKQVKPKKDVCKANSDKNNNPGKEKRGVPKTATNNVITPVAKTRGKSVISPIKQSRAKDKITLALKTRRNNVTSHMVKTRDKDETSFVAQCQSKDEITSGIKTSGKNVMSPVAKTRAKDEITPVPKTSGNNVISPLAKTRGKNEITPVLKTRGKNVVAPVIKSRGKDKTSPLSKLLNTNKISPVKKPVNKTPNYKKDFSYRILEDKVSPKIIEEKLAVYDFTFDPSEEPPPQKKKKKVVRKKGPPKQKRYAYNNYYEHNVSNALEALKMVVKQKLVNNAKQNPISIDEIAEKSQPAPVMGNENPRQTEVHFSEINYSPCHSPNNITTKETLVNNVEDLRPKSMSNTKVVNKNIINIQDEISFFDDVPIANSSMNESVRNPNASPWRVEFKNLPIKWAPNTYIKANMTPAVDSSYINPEDIGKKQVYTNILFNDLDKVNTSDNPKLKQTSITTFMKDGNEKVLQNENKVLTPTKDNSVFDDSKSDYSNPKPVPDDNFVPKLDISLELNENNKSNINSTPLKRKNDEVLNEVPSKTRKEVVATAENFFGFDESTINDQENISPDKVSKKIVQKPKLPKKVLQEKNQLAGPMRANLPRFVKNKILDQVQVPLAIPSVNNVTDNDLVQPVAENSDLEDEENSGSDKEESTPIGLFEDIEIVHHNKPTRKSYGKAKKVAFRQQTAMEADELDVDTTGDSDLVDDTSFHVPLVRVRKPGKKHKVQKRSKQEEKEVEAWAAGFNSMCEDVENFDLVVE